MSLQVKTGERTRQLYYLLFIKKYQNFRFTSTIITTIVTILLLSLLPLCHHYTTIPVLHSGTIDNFLFVLDLSRINMDIMWSFWNVSFLIRSSVTATCCDRKKSITYPNFRECQQGIPIIIVLSRGLTVSLAEVVIICLL